MVAPTARTSKARETFLARFEDPADADLEPEERERRVEERKRKYFTELSRRAAEARTLAARTTAAQGLPLKLSDPGALEVVAVVFMAGLVDDAA